MCAGALATAIKDFKGGIFMISHNAEFYEALCPEKWILESGRVRLHTYIHTYIHTYTTWATCLHSYIHTCPVADGDGCGVDGGGGEGPQEGREAGQEDAGPDPGRREEGRARKHHRRGATPVYVCMREGVVSAVYVCVCR